MEQVIATWEIGAPLLPLDRALVVLSAGGLDEPLDELPLAARDRALLEMRSATFGDELSATASCPACEAVAEVRVGCRELADAIIDHPTEELSLGGTTVSIRSVSSRDLAEAVQASSGALDEEVRRRVLEPGSGTDLSADQLDRVAERIEERERDVEVRLALTCPECATTWSAVFDPVEFFWAEIVEAAQRALRDVADIAAAFGWSEADILAMTDTRRSRYLGLARER